ncbi:MAG: hypothetical protein EOP49_26730 [Sphingobacteriales bacterium]|nr:MAG: hypothetical protein EOP49_26730 [Sphingobacteriales bacterium]
MSLFRPQQSRITLKNPCTESQDNMRPIAGGQFCNTCQKPVTDFTNFSDEEFIRYFQTHKASGCGKFKERQLSLTIPEKAFWQPFQNIMKPAAALLVSLSLYGAAHARAGQLSSLVQLEPQPDTIPAPKLNTATTKVSGIVFAENGDPEAGASVFVKGTKEGTMTDENGAFQLEMPDGNRTIVVKSVGCKDKEAFIGAYNIVKVQLEQLDDFSEIGIFGGYMALPIKVPAGILKNEAKRSGSNKGSKKSSFPCSTDKQSMRK